MRQEICYRLDLTLTKQFLWPNYRNQCCENINVISDKSYGHINIKEYNFLEIIHSHSVMWSYGGIASDFS